MLTNVYNKWPLILLAIILLAAVVAYFMSRQQPTMTIRLADQELRVLVADTYARQFKGWSDQETMGDYMGMWFPFGYSGRHTMVMRDMHFPLDIVWLQDGEIVDIAPNLAPEPDRAENALTRYTPRLPANAVLELPAGFIERVGVKIGDTVAIGQ